MQVYELPPNALAESSCFSVTSADGSELLAVPQGCKDIPARFVGFIYLPWNAESILGAPITPTTLIPEAFADLFPANPVLISSQICGGTLESRLTDALAQFGERAFFCIEPMRHILPLPCPDAQPKPIDNIESKRIRQNLTSHYTDAFCCNYCIDTKSKCALLYDTAETAKRKIELAQSLNIRHVLCLPT